MATARVEDPTKNIVSLGNSIVKQLKTVQNPDITLPVRSLSNIFFDESTKLITLGDKVSHRTYLNAAHTRKFMQTLMVAAECKKLLGQKQHTTTSIRDLYYILKRTLPGTDENTFEEQEESVWPDEPLLVRIDNQLKILPGSEVLEYAEKTGKKIYDKDGKIRITDVNIKVCAFDKNQNIEEHKVLMVMKHPSKKSKKIKTSSGRVVKVTPAHSLFTADENGKPKSLEVKNLKAGDWIALPRRIKINVNSEPINLIDCFIKRAPENVLEKIYLKGERDVINKLIGSIDKKSLKKYCEKYSNVWSDVAANWKHWNTVPMSLIKETDTDIKEFLHKLKLSVKGGNNQYNLIIQKDENLGLVLGYLLSEAGHSLFTRERDEMQITLANKSEKIISDFIGAFKTSFGQEINGKPNKDKDGVYRLNIGYNLLSYILEYAFDYGPERAWEKELPSVLLDSPEPCIKAFLKAFRYGDGSVYKPKNRIRFHTTSTGLVNGLVFLLLRLGIFSNIYEHKRHEPQHTAYEVRVGARHYAKILSEITEDVWLADSKKTASSSDKIPHIGKLLRNLRKSCSSLPEHLYKQISWHEIEKKNAVTREIAAKIINTLEQHSPEKELMESIKETVNSDIYWDKVVEIGDAGEPPYTIDIAVNPTQNFIGGQGFLILHNSDPLLEDIEVAMNTLRENLHLHADQKGSLAGPLIVREPNFNTESDCTKAGASGYGVPSICEPDTVELVSTDADFVLVVEKQAVWQRLNEDRFWKKHNCLILTGKGQPDRGTRRMINRLHNELKLPVYVVTDADAWGYYIYSVIKQGSINLSFVSDRLGTPDAKFVGLTTQDVVKFNIPKNVTIKLNEGDKKRIQELLNYMWFKPKEWQHELKNMLQVGYKLELESLSNKDIRFITEKYLPEKLAKKDFLP